MWWNLDASKNLTCELPGPRGSRLHAVATIQKDLDGLIEAFQKKRIAGDNPWGEGATTLEWQLPSPPPFHQWEELPRIT